MHLGRCSRAEVGRWERGSREAGQKREVEAGKRGGRSGEEGRQELGSGVTGQKQGGRRGEAERQEKAGPA